MMETEVKRYKRVAVENLGCKVNRYESDAAIMQFQDRGYEIVDYSEIADIYVLNTCAVTVEAARKSRQQLNRAKRLNPNSIVVAMGCQAELVGDDLPCDLSVGNANKPHIVEIVEKFIEEGTPADHVDIATVRDFREMGSISRQKETRAYLKVQDGCNSFCSYCTIPYARGRVRSRKVENILAEARDLAEAGYKEIVLTGIHVCSFGQDRGEDSTALIYLAGALDQIGGIERIRLSSLEPQSITEEFVRLASEVKHLCPHFHLSMQSGSDTILRSMNRKYDTKVFMEAVNRIHKYFPVAGITSDVIVGFPGETDALFEETIAFCQDVGFSRMHVFRYSERPGTRAVDFPNKVDGNVARARSQRLMEIADASQEAYNQSRKGETATVLLEQKNAQGNWQGYTTDYILTEIVDSKESVKTYEEGEIVTVLLKESHTSHMSGEML